jgi:protein-disulfide isomerase
LVRTPAALSAALVFVAAAVATLALFPGQPLSAAPGADQAQPAALPTPAADQVKDFEKYLAAQPRVAVMVPSDGAAVVLVKFNDYQCPPCRQTFMDYKPVKAKWDKEAPGKVKFVTKDYPLDGECNPRGGTLHPAACEAAVAVRLAREKGKADAMEDWLFANQPAMSPDKVRQGVREVAGVTDMDQRYAATLELVKSDIAQGASLQVGSTPTFFLNGIKLPGLRPEFMDVAIAWELKRVSGGSR